MTGIIQKVRDAVKDTPTYLSIDIDGNLFTVLRFRNDTNETSAGP